MTMTMCPAFSQSKAGTSDISQSTKLDLPRFRDPRAVSGEIVQHEGFTLCYNEGLRIPDWVSWTLTREEAEATVASRTDEFLPDPDVKGYCPDTRQYSRSGYDRGHMAPAADMKWSETAMRESFYLTNICPQKKLLNEGLWLELEQRCRVYAKRHGQIDIIAGPITGSHPQRIGSEGVAVPEAFFKVMAIETPQGVKAIGFIMPNADLDRNDDIFLYSVSVQEVERRTGLTFWEGRNMKKATIDKPFWDIAWKKR